jgi:hypothetical protein
MLINDKIQERKVQYNSQQILFKQLYKIIKINWVTKSSTVITSLHNVIVGVLGQSPNSPTTLCVVGSPSLRSISIFLIILEELLSALES